MRSQQEILFFVFILFFVLIGTISLLVLIGLVKTADKNFKKWAVPGFVGAVTTAVIGLFTNEPAATQLKLADIVLLLSIAEDAPGVAAFEECSYTMDEMTTDGPQAKKFQLKRPVKAPGKEGQDGRVWEVKLPGTIAEEAIELILIDDQKHPWKVDRFYPNRVTQNITPSTPMPMQLREDKVSAERSRWPSILPVAFASSKPLRDSEQSVTLRHEAKLVSNQRGETRYDWRLYVSEPANTLDRIAEVEYTLPSSFLNPFRTSRDRSRAFELVESSGGGFAVVVTVRFKDGSLTKVAYPLSFAAVSGATSARELTLERIGVEWDGSSGSTGWVFDVSVDGQTVFQIPNRNYDDGGQHDGGGNQHLPSEQGVLSRTITLSSSARFRIDVKGKRSFWFSGDEVAGSAVGYSDGGPIAIRVTDPNDAKDGSFIFYFKTSRK